MGDDLSMKDIGPYGSRQVHNRMACKKFCPCIVIRHRPEEELYDLNKDPFQLHNLAGNDQYNEIKRKLRKELDHFMKQQGDEGLQTEMKAFGRQPKNRAKE